MNKTFSAECDFSCVRQIARADRFACVLTRAHAIAHVKRKGLVNIFEPGIPQGLTVEAGIPQVLIFLRLEFLKGSGFSSWNSSGDSGF